MRDAREAWQRVIPAELQAAPAGRALEFRLQARQSDWSFRWSIEVSEFSLWNTWQVVGFFDLDKIWENTQAVFQWSNCGMFGNWLNHPDEETGVGDIRFPSLSNLEAFVVVFFWLLLIQNPFRKIPYKSRGSRFRTVWWLQDVLTLFQKSGHARQPRVRLGSPLFGGGKKSP